MRIILQQVSVFNPCMNINGKEKNLLEDYLKYNKLRSELILPDRAGLEKVAGFKLSENVLKINGIAIGERRREETDARWP
jgi:hypothetical protein